MDFAQLWLIMKLSPAVLLYGSGDPRTAGEAAVPRVPTGTGSAIRPTHANSKFDPSILPFIGLLDCARADDGKVTKEGELRPL